jgi:D-3-phosphoglycerate dehydrogenase
MKIVILCPKAEFTKSQQKRLAQLGETVYTASRDEYPMDKLIQMSKDANILSFDPANVGGWEVASERLMCLMEAIPNLIGLALGTTAFGHVDLNYCKNRKIVVTNVPYYSTESVAEHAMALILGCAKRIFLSDRRTQQGKYQLVQGYELKGKTLGIIGLGHIGQRTAELGKAIGMRVIGWNRSPKLLSGIDIFPLDEFLAESDVISIHLADCKETRGFLSRERINRLKIGVVVVNTADRSMVDEDAMAEALISHRVDSYALEAENLTLPPLGMVENAFLFKAFGWYTKEALERNKEIWIDNIEGIIKRQPINQIV